MKFGRAGLQVLITIVVMVISFGAQALSFVMMNDRALAERADGVARIKILQRLPALDGDTRTAYLVEWVETLRGSSLRPIETLLLPGTIDAPHANLSVPGVPRLEAGQTLLVFFNRLDKGALVATELSMGLFFELNQAGQRIYTRNIDGHIDDSTRKNAAYYADRDAYRFESWLRSGAAAKAADYFVRPGASAKFTFLDFANDRARWFEFDTDQTLPWRAAADGQDGVETDEFAALQTGLAAWTNDPDSRIRLSYQGTGTLSAAFSGNVTWNVDLSENGGPSGPYDCEAGGILALGGLTGRTPLTVSNGNNYYFGQNGFVKVRLNAACFLNGSGGLNTAETLAHEIGHGLGFGHSCGDSASPSCSSNANFDNALMRFNLHGDRGAVLGVDDRAAAAESYPNAVALPPAADLTISKSTATSTVSPDDTITFTITVRNTGPDSAQAVQVSDPTPSGLTFVSNSGACTGAFPCSLGTVGNGVSAVITARYRVSSNGTDVPVITNTAAVTSSTADPSSSNNTASRQVSVVGPSADLSISKSSTATIFHPEDSVDFTINVHNNGPDAADNVRVSDSTPSGLTFVSNSGDCSSAFPCTLGTLASGESMSITARYRVNSTTSDGQLISNSASVSSTTDDPTSSNNASTQQISVDTTNPLVAGFDAATLPANNDGSTGAIPLGFEVNLFGTLSRSVYVNNNGNVTFDHPLGAFAPSSLLATQRLIIAPFFADVDTRSSGNPVTYGSGTFEGHAAFGVNWNGVDYHVGNATHSRSNHFQLLLVSRVDRGAGDFDIIFNYDRIQWESGGSDSGLGGDSARAGYSIGAGAPGSTFELTGSAINGALIDGGSHALTAGSRGSAVPGRYRFEIRSAREARVSALTPVADAPTLGGASDGSGRYVVFQSRATNLTGSDPNPGVDIFRVDTLTGETVLVSLDNSGSGIGGDASEPAVSRDGNLVLFVAPDAAVAQLKGESSEKRLQRQKGSGSGVFLRDILTGTTERVGSGASSGTGSGPSVSGESTHIVYIGINTDPFLGTLGQDNVFLAPLNVSGKSLSIGTARCVSCKSVNPDGSDSLTPSNGAAANPSVSADGSHVVWTSTASNALADVPAACPGASSSVLLRDMLTGAMTTVSAPTTGGSCGSGSSSNPQIDDAGTHVVFESNQPLTNADSNSAADIFVFSAATSSLQRVSESSTGVQGNGASFTPTISADGNVVAFISEATNLDPAVSDTNGVADLHVRALLGGAMAQLSSTDSGQQSDAASARPSLNADGSRVVFESASSNLAPGATAGQSQVFQRANPLVTTALRSAIWWNADESGWGLFVFDQGNFLVPAWFTYDFDGEPTWLLADGAYPQADGSYQGELYRYTGVPLAQISGIASDPPSLIGDVQLRFEGEEALEFAYTVDGISQTKNLSRFPFGSRNVSCHASDSSSRASALNYTDVWWGGADTAGWGLFLYHVDDHLVTLWYTYDTDREALFLLVDTTRQDDGTFSGSIYRQRDGIAFSLIDGQPPSPGNDLIGTASFNFSDGETGVFSYTLGGVDQSKPITRLLAGNVPSECETVPVGR